MPPPSSPSTLPIPLSSPPAPHLSILAGTTSGLTKLLLGYPLDVLKLLVQTSPPSTFPGKGPATARAFAATVKAHGVKGLYRGGSVPAFGWTVTDGVMLGVLWEARRWLFDGGRGVWTEVGGESAEGRRLSLGGHAIAGAIGGIAVTPISHPVDLVKSKLQAQLRPSPSTTLPYHQVSHSRPLPAPTHSNFPSHLFHPSHVSHPVLPSPNPYAYAHTHSPYHHPYSYSQQRCLHTLTRSARLAKLAPPAFESPMHCALTLAKDGALYRGVGWTLAIRTGTGGLFCLYEMMHRTLKPSSLPAPVQTLLAGSTAYLAFWTIFLPADNIRSRLLVDSHLHPRYPTSKSVIRAIWRGASTDPKASRVTRAKAFWRGAGAVGLRAGGVNGCALLVWEGVMRSMGERSA